MKILLGAMSLGIGGAETHILDLALTLQARGHTVVIASAGGVLEKQAAQGGVRCVHVPLNLPSPPLMLAAEVKLDRLIAREHFDLVHAHARIPAFLLGRICRRRGIPMLTTAHGTFRTTPLLRRISDWGDATLAVSCHIKEYLLREYALPEQSVHLTVNGIDTVRFSPAAIAPPPHRILCVSRLDPDADAAARLLIRLAPALKKRFPDLTITIVGSGSVEKELRASAVSYPYLTFLGARTDIPDLLRGASLFVGVSRAALEAMACGLPTILTGNRGSIGLLTKETEQIACETNFCCPERKMNDKSLLTEIVGALSLSPAKRAAIGAENRSLVIRHYSLARMTDDAETLYRRLLPKSTDAKRLLLLGYYGYRNCGDEYLLQGLLERLQKNTPPPDVTLITATPAHDHLAFGVKAIARTDPALITALRSADAFLLGGGSLLSDHPSLRSIAYYTAMRDLAEKSRCTTHLCALGIGPFSTSRGKALAAAALSRADSVSVRDRASLALASRLGAKAPTLTEDPALSAPEPDPRWIAYLRNRLDLPQKAFFLVALRPLPDMTQAQIKRLATILAAFAARSGKTPLFAVMHEGEDRPLSDKIARLVGGRVLPPLTGSELHGIAQACAFALPMRLHATILAYRAEIPTLALSYDPKIDAFCTEHGIPFLPVCSLSEVSVSRMWSMLCKEPLFPGAKPTLRE